jgi:hypothetical protein
MAMLPVALCGVCAKGRPDHDHGPGCGQSTRLPQGLHSKTDAKASQKKPRDVRGFEVFKQGGVKQSGFEPLGAIRSRITISKISLTPYQIINDNNLKMKFCP